MNPEVVALSPSSTVDDAIGVLREADEDTITAAVYAVDDDRRLLGLVRLRHLVTALPNTRLDEIWEAVKREGR